MTDCCIYRAANCCTLPVWITYLYRFQEAVEKTQNKAAGKEYLMKVSFMQMWTYCTKAASLPYERYKDPEAAAGEKRLFRPFFLLFLEAAEITVGKAQRGLMLDLLRCWFYAKAAREGLCAEISRSCLMSCVLNTPLMGAAVLVPPSPRGG